MSAHQRTGFCVLFLAFLCFWEVCAQRCHNENKFMCNNKNCVVQCQRCNIRDNCGDSSDEYNCDVVMKDCIDQTGHDREEKTCYLVVKKPQTWESAKADCESHGMTLAVISSREEMSIVRNILGKFSNPIFWLGLKRDGRVYRWVDGTTFPSNGLVWGQNQPQIGEDCGIYWIDQDIHDSICRAVYWALCEQRVLMYPPVDHCSSSPCGENGDCINGRTGHMCSCHPGFSGPSCDVEIGPCSSSPCGQNAQCINTLTGPACTCLPGFTGRNCDVKIDHCSSSPCGENGECINSVTGHACICHDGFTGPSCDYGVSSTLENETGHFEEGVSSTLENETGHFEEDMSISAEGEKFWIKVGISAVAGLELLVIIILSVVLRRKSKGGHLSCLAQRRDKDVNECATEKPYISLLELSSPSTAGPSTTTTTTTTAAATTATATATAGSQLPRFRSEPQPQTDEDYLTPVEENVYEPAAEEEPLDDVYTDPDAQ